MPMLIIESKLFSGDPIPRVDYTAAEHRTWKEVYSKLKTLYPTLACTEYQRSLQNFERDGIFTTERIPQLEDVSRYLKSKVLYWFPELYTRLVLVWLEKHNRVSDYDYDMQLAF